MMVEAGANELPEDVILDAILFGHEEIKRLVEFQQEIQAACGKEKSEPKLFLVPQEMEEAIRDYAKDRLDAAVRNSDKLDRDAHIADITTDTMEHFLELYPEMDKEIAIAIHDLEKSVVRHMITHEKIRPDGREVEEVRPVSCEVGLLPRTHGSGLFTRGQTQILTVTTLGSLGDEQIIDGLGPERRSIISITITSRVTVSAKLARCAARAAARSVMAHSPSGLLSPWSRPLRSSRIPSASFRRYLNRMVRVRWVRSAAVRSR